MKKRLYIILGVIVYSCVLCGLLAIQLLMIDGIFPRLLANLSALLLTLPTILIMLLYHKHMHSHSTQKQESNQVSVSAEPLSDASSTEEIRIRLYDCLHQKSLSNREVEVAWLIFRGYTNLHIAEELYISEATVKKHASHIYEKLEVTGRKEFKSYLKTLIAAK